MYPLKMVAHTRPQESDFPRARKLHITTMVCSLAGNRWFSAPTRALGPLAVRAASYPCQEPRAPEDRALALPVRLPWRHRWRSPEATQDAQSLVGKREGCPAARRMLQIVLPPCALFGELPSPGGCGA